MEWQQYMQLDWEARGGQHAFGYSCGWKEVLDRERIQQSGFRYVGLAG